MIVLAVVAAVALVLLLATDVAMVLMHNRHIAQVADLLEAQARERHAWDQQRWELNTRIQAPEVARVAPPAPPAPVGADEDAEPRDEDDVDESWLVGVNHG